jgi:hypothetical protein
MEATAKGLLAPCIQMEDMWLIQKKKNINQIINDYHCLRRSSVA